MGVLKKKKRESGVRSPYVIEGGNLRRRGY